MCTIIAYMCQDECIIDSCIADIYIVKLICMMFLLYHPPCVMQNVFFFCIFSFFIFFSFDQFSFLLSSYLFFCYLIFSAQDTHMNNYVTTTQ